MPVLRQLKGKKEWYWHFIFFLTFGCTFLWSQSYVILAALLQLCPIRCIYLFSDADYYHLICHLKQLAKCFKDIKVSETDTTCEWYLLILSLVKVVRRYDMGCTMLHSLVLYCIASTCAWCIRSACTCCYKMREGRLWHCRQVVKAGRRLCALAAQCAMSGEICAVTCDSVYDHVKLCTIGADNESLLYHICQNDVWDHTF